MVYCWAWEFLLFIGIIHSSVHPDWLYTSKCKSILSYINFQHCTRNKVLTFNFAHKTQTKKKSFFKGGEDKEIVEILKREEWGRKREGVRRKRLGVRRKREEWEAEKEGERMKERTQVKLFPTSCVCLWLCVCITVSPSLLFVPCTSATNRRAWKCSYSL